MPAWVLPETRVRLPVLIIVRWGDSASSDVGLPRCVQEHNVRLDDPQGHANASPTAATEAVCSLNHIVASHTHIHNFTISHAHYYMYLYMMRVYTKV